MQKDVLIFFKTIQEMEDGPGDDFEIITAGQYFEKNGKIYVLYDDADETTKKITRNTIKITSEKMVEVKRSGNAQVHMIFREGEKTYSTYQTLVGEMMVGFETTNIDILEEEDLLHVRLQYALEVNGAITSDNTVELRVESKDTCKMNLSSIF